MSTDDWLAFLLDTLFPSISFCISSALVLPLFGLPMDLAVDALIRSFYVFFHSSWCCGLCGSSR
jgi:hypothetical protein